METLGLLFRMKKIDLQGQIETDDLSLYLYMERVDVILDSYRAIEIPHIPRDLYNTYDAGINIACLRTNPSPRL